MLAINSKPKYEIYDTVANCIKESRDDFASHAIFKALLHHIFNENNNGSIMKCLALLVCCEQGAQFAEESNFIEVPISIIESQVFDEELKFYSVMALRNLILNKKYPNNQLTQWKSVMKPLIKFSSTKRSPKLQEISLQTLRILSDKYSIKKELKKFHKCKIQQIVCLSKESEYFRNDLIQHLVYRSYKPHKSEKYASMFI